MLKRHKQSDLAVLALIVLVVLGLGAGGSLAQQSLGPWPSLEIRVSPEEVSIGEGFLTTLTLRNEGTDAVTIDAVTAELPAGAVYVGQAYGSDVAEDAETRQSQLRWTGPFTLPASAELNIDFWAMTTSPASPGQYLVQAAALSGEQPQVSAEIPLTLLPEAAPELAPASQPPRLEAAPAVPSAVVVRKTAEPSLVIANNRVAYTVTFTNNGSEDESLDTITDLLPAGFRYAGMAYGSEIPNEPPPAQVGRELVWQWEVDLPVVPAGGTLTLRYYVWVPGMIWDDTMVYTNSVMAHYDDTTIGPAPADVRIKVFRLHLPVLFHDFTYPYFTVTKSANLATVEPEGEVAYTVRLTNGGNDPGILKTIEDTLPTGFIFKGTVSGPAGLSSPTSGATGKIVWSGSVTVPAGASVTLVYKVQVSKTPGTYVNSATATTLVGRPPAAPASATVTVKESTTLPFEDTFDSGLSSDWAVFLNYPGLSTKDWYWLGQAPSWGMYVYDASEGTGWDGYALAMYLGPGSQDWSDYEVVATIKDRSERLGGLWIRGTYEARSDMQGGKVGGYYVHIRPQNNYVYLQRIPPQDQRFHTAGIVAVGQYGPGIGNVAWYDLKVQARGANIKVWLKKTDEPDSDYVLLINWDDPDGAYMKGTVGFSVFRANVLYDYIKVTSLSASGQ